MNAKIISFDQENDVFMLQADSVKFSVNAKHIPLEANESEPLDAINREVQMNKTLKAFFTKAKNAKEKQAAKEEAMQFEAKIAAQRTAENAQQAILRALQVRIDCAPNGNQAGTVRSEQKMLEGAKALHAIGVVAALGVDLFTLAKRIEIKTKEEDKENFVGVYVIEKIRKAIFAIAAKSTSGFDKYTNSILKNLSKLQSLDNLNTQRAICSKIEMDELAQSQAIRVYHNCAPSTASTQASSTRMMAFHLNICNVRKGIKGDSISFADSDIAKLVQEMYA